ncbi:hypothetical protein JG687_00009372 [Phytophthora cactorum]|nr:hypothetical protein PC115_g11895 [Phytophthora cactorum]KAG3216142.1 hypothetical protein PC129_g12987 [Phytophthora cactorum]KAG4052498.1 hypothetical protein PC123_g12311 [Phytophthora cactorum]KAG6958474.1 hypothetical protein JG687_00009372 [Phytophthora cactorum]RAW39829.1 hypothetical protein PC110_g3921 [Phytophthora cactorum]
MQRVLIELEGDALELELMVKIRALSSTWIAKYMFQLKPYSVERVDIVEAKLRGVEEELERTKSAWLIKKAKEVVHLASFSRNMDNLNDNGEIIWNDLKCVNFKPNNERNGIIFLVGGWYIVNSTVYLVQQSSEDHVKLRKNNSRLLESKVPKIVGESTSASLGWSGLLKENGELPVAATKSPHKVGSQLTVLRLNE